MDVGRNVSCVSWQVLHVTPEARHQCTMQFHPSYQKYMWIGLNILGSGSLTMMNCLRLQTLQSMTYSRPSARR